MGQGIYFRGKEKAATIQVVVVWCSDTAKSSSTRSALPVNAIAEAGIHSRCCFSCPAECLIQQFLDLEFPS